MNIQDFRIFFDIVYYNSFSQAAVHNHVSQSAVSQAVRRIEEELNSKLIDRSARPFNLTKAGKRFYEGSKKMLDTYETIKAEVLAGDEDIAGIVRVGAIYSVGLIELNQYIQKFIRMHPKCNVRLSYQRPNLIYDMLDKDEIDMGVVSYPTSRSDIKIERWRNESMALVCHPDHPLAIRSRIAARQLHGEKLIAFDPDLQIRKEIDKWLASSDIEVDVVMEFDNIENIKQAVEINAGVAILPLPTVERDMHYRHLAVVPLETSRLIRPVGIVYKKHKKLDDVALNFIDYLMSVPDMAAPPRTSVAGS